MIKEEEKMFIINTYNRSPEHTLLLVRGKGTLVYDDEGNEYLDFVGGLAVNALGHSHPDVINAAWEQMNRIMHTSNLYYTEPQVKLAKCLVENSAAGKVFFCNSGAEANEAAIKLARKYMKLQAGRGKYEIITAYNSFHGRTLATITATGQQKYQHYFEPLLPGFRYAEFNNLQSFASQVNEHTCAIMAEPVQGEGGVHVATEEFFLGLRRLCDDNNILLVLDEVQCGMGRTGKLFAYEHYGITPDIFTLAKALGGGLPIGAMLCSDRVSSGFAPGDHASTFGGNPVACAAALAVMNALLRENFLKEVQDRGRYFREKLEKLKAAYPGLIKEIRSRGMIAGVDLAAGAQAGAQAVQRECLQKGLLVNCIGERTLRFLPPLNVSSEEIDSAVGIFEEVLVETKKN